MGTDDRETEPKTNDALDGGLDGKKDDKDDRSFGVGETIEFDI
jgi:hypothetical protein